MIKSPLWVFYGVFYGSREFTRVVQKKALMSLLYNMASRRWWHGLWAWHTSSRPRDVQQRCKFLNSHGASTSSAKTTPDRFHNYLRSSPIEMCIEPIRSRLWTAVAATCNLEGSAQSSDTAHQMAGELPLIRSLPVIWMTPSNIKFELFNKSSYK
jgi:hypothetical protein